MKNKIYITENEIADLILEMYDGKQWIKVGKENLKTVWENLGNGTIYYRIVDKDGNVIIDKTPM